MMKKSFVFILVILILLIISGVAIVSFCNSDNEEELLKEKLQSEIDFLDTKISGMLNSVNGLILQNYKVNVEKIEDSSEDITSEDESSSSSKSSGDSQNTKQDSSSKDESNYQYKMTENITLTSQRNTNWDELAYDIEILNSSWATITLDLYKQNIDGQSILGFNTDLDNTIKAVKAKNKQETLSYLAKLYSYLPIYEQGFNNDTTQINVYNVRSCVYNAYALIEQNNNDEVSKQLQSAENFLVTMMNNIDITQKEFNLNKAYILLKDLQNSVDLNDVDIFYVKYKNLYEEINML
jgi:hypothetical protein